MKVRSSDDVAAVDSYLSKNGHVTKRKLDKGSRDKKAKPKKALMNIETFVKNIKSLNKFENKAAENLFLEKITKTGKILNGNSIWEVK